ncbi:ribosomal protein S18-alanine N-acetyltransferase [Rhodoferax bucti]|uniref:ribosomal protein S18-alanine N-acetyltransferase n=1 Tax=Rhodoferax bucti TaxID=2576305 RepID=UPI001107C9B5|nr:ribosomal protein S18-alanine N-acetyltransferase [Rhodoferax bucti]
MSPYSAVPPADVTHEAAFEPLLADDLDRVLQVEQLAYSHPWSRANFVDALHSGYQAQMLTANGQLLGYFVAMKGVDEVHLLNITVAPEFQCQGWARVLLDALAIWSRGQGAQWLWLEVRVSNDRALRVYEAHGYRRVGQRKGYYPAHNGQREDAVVMSLSLER